MLTVVSKQGFVSVQAMAAALIGDLKNILTLKDPANFVAGTTVSATFESSAAVDSLSATQPWRLRIETDDKEHMTVFAGTNLQLPDDGTVALLDNGVSRAGELGEKPLSGGSGDRNTYFINRAHLQLSQRQSYPLSYRIAATSHGLSVFIWEPDTENYISNYSWFVIQRPTNNLSGVALDTGKAPVFCMYAIKRDASNWSGGTDDLAVTLDTDRIYKFVVREADVLRPSPAADATVDSEDSTRSINAEPQVAITEDSKYVLTFPNGLHTSRFAYPNYELDMVAYSSADVISETSLAEISVYGEAAPRKYIAHKCNLPRNTGMRIFQIAESTSPNV